MLPVQALIALATPVLLLLIWLGACGPAAAPSPEPMGPAVLLHGVAVPVELALTPEEQRQGLSDRPSLAPGTGMLFVFETEHALTFWMRNMHFPLDMVWIDAGCTVVDISQDVPPPTPGTPNSVLPRYSPDGPARYVLEINAGESGALGLGPGDRVSFAGTISGDYGC